MKPSPAWLRLSLPFAIAAVTLAVYWPVLDNEFVSWGDNQEIVTNEHCRGFAPDDLAWMFTKIFMGHYQPLTWLTFALDYQTHGLDSRGYHRTSLLLHAACAVAAYFLIRRLVRLARRDREPGAETGVALLVAAAAALLFALHPLRVEAVAWAVERRGLLSGLFSICCVYLYLSYAGEDPGGRRAVARPTAFRLSVVMFLLALLAKEFSLTLPAVLLVLDVYPLRRLEAGADRWHALRPLVVEKWPFALLTLIWTWIAFVSSQQSTVAKSLEQHDLLDRLAQSAYGLAFYLAKTLVPTRLSNLYPLPLDLAPFEPRFLASAMAVVAVTLVLVLLRKRYPAGLTAWVCYVILVAPVLGLLQTGHQIAADRYTYLPALGLSAVAAGLLLGAFSNRTPAAGRIAIAGTTLLVLAVLGSLTREQLRVWRTSESLWGHALAISPWSPIVNHNYGIALGTAGRPQEAIPYVVRAIELDEHYLDAYNNHGSLLAMTGRLPEAIEQWQAALRIDPANRTALENLERARAMLGAKE